MLGKLAAGEVAVGEVVTGKIVLGKLRWGNDLTPCNIFKKYLLFIIAQPVPFGCMRSGLCQNMTSPLSLV